jgi:hypothetical protein
MHRPSYPMRMVLALLVFAGCSVMLTATPASDRDPDAQTQATPALAVEQVRLPLKGLRDEAAMVLVGTALIGLAAAVRRAA